MHFGIGQVIDQFRERVGRLDGALGVLVEVLKKLAFGGHEATEHDDPWERKKAGVVKTTPDGITAGAVIKTQYFTGTGPATRGTL
ncbi:hypothetical protein [Ralstonia sp. 1138]|uniref:hypothetical protein n=1 Tax=Ralstonia sp. 1138 TaxID=3156423 RepID=UPI0033990545